VLAACLVAALSRGAAAEEMLYPYAERESGPWGYIDKTGRVVVSLQFEAAASFSEGLAAIKLDKKFGFIDGAGRVVVKPRFDEVRPFQSGRASVKVGAFHCEWGKTAKSSTPDGDASSASRPIRRPCRDGDWGFIDETGAEIVPPSYALTWSFNGDYATVRVKQGGRVGVMDRAGQMVIAPDFDWVGDFSEGLATALRAHKYGYIDTNGKVVIPFQFERAFAFRGGRAAVFQDVGGRSGFIDKAGTLTPFDFTMVYEFSEGLAVVADKNRRFGAINANGQVVIPPRFVHVGAAEGEPDFRKAFMFSEGLLPVHDGRAFGYIDRQGRYVIDPQFPRAGPFRGGLAVVYADAKLALGPYATKERQLMGLIDLSGKFVAPPVYDWARPKPGGLVQVKFGERLGYLDSKGRPLTFTDEDVKAYLAETLERLKPPPPPPPGRAVVGTAGDTQYYLRLPDGICAFDLTVPQDRKFIEEMWNKGAADLEAARKKMPQLSEDGWRELKRTNVEIKANTGLLAKCDQLEAVRSGGDETLHTYAVASGLQKDRYDPTGNAGLVYMVALMCRLADKDSMGSPRPKDNSVRVWNAFKRLEGGESTPLPALDWEALACYSAAVMPAEGDAGAAPQAPAKAKVRFHTMFLLPDWMVQMFTQETIDATPEALFQVLQQQKAVVRTFEDANLKRPTASARH
jgi:hypothetical protein